MRRACVSDRRGKMKRSRVADEETSREEVDRLRPFRSCGGKTLCLCRDKEAKVNLAHGRGRNSYSGTRAYFWPSEVTLLAQDLALHKVRPLGMSDESDRSCPPLVCLCRVPRWEKLPSESASCSKPAIRVRKVVPEGQRQAMCEAMPGLRVTDKPRRACACTDARMPDSLRVRDNRSVARMLE